VFVLISVRAWHWHEYLGIYEHANGNQFSLLPIPWFRVTWPHKGPYVTGPHSPLQVRPWLILSQDTPITSQDTTIPVASQATPVTSQTMPTACQATPLPNAGQTTSITSQATPITSQATPIPRQATPITCQATPIVSLVMPITSYSGPLTRVSHFHINAQLRYIYGYSEPLYSRLS
jgi:hypothetical protein